MEIRNSKLNGNRMEVLGLVSIQLPSPWWWSGQDIEDVKAKGAAFRTFAGGEEDEEVDVTRPPKSSPKVKLIKTIW